MLVNSSLAPSPVSLTCCFERYTKQRSPTSPFERRKGLNHLPMSQSISGNFTAQWDTALVLPELDNAAFREYEFPIKKCLLHLELRLFHLGKGDHSLRMGKVTKPKHSEAFQS